MVSEFEFIENIKSRYSLDKIGDDCAVLPKDADTDLLLTADMLVEDVDFHSSFRKSRSFASVQSREWEWWSVCKS